MLTHFNLMFHRSTPIYFTLRKIEVSLFTVDTKQNFNGFAHSIQSTEETKFCRGWILFVGKDMYSLHDVLHEAVQHIRDIALRIAQIRFERGDYVDFYEDVRLGHFDASFHSIALHSLRDSMDLYLAVCREFFHIVPCEDLARKVRGITA